MADKEVISLRIASRDITLACPKKDVQGLKEAANILNQEESQYRIKIMQLF